jgi:hypothetical protein
LFQFLQDLKNRLCSFHKIEVKKQDIDTISTISTMFSSYTYNTLKYCGIPVPVDIPFEKFSKRESDFLEKNKLKNTICQSPNYTIQTLNNNVFNGCSRKHKQETIPTKRLFTFSIMKFTGVRYIDNIILEYEGVNTIEELVSFTMKELKVLVKKNYGTVKGDKRRRQSWVYAYIDTVLLGFNTFAVRSQLTDDLLCEIRKYL